MRHDPIARLHEELARLPGIGPRSAMRLAYYIVRKNHRGVRLAQDLASALTSAAEQVGLCSACQDFSTSELCGICSDPRRDDRQICVVESASDIRAMEATQVYRGKYFVLHGVMNPLEGVGPEELALGRLVELCAQRQVEEVVVATNASVEGDATAMYIGSLLEESSVQVTRLASGIPMGGEIEYLDSATLMRAFEDRRRVD